MADRRVNRSPGRRTGNCRSFSLILPACKAPGGPPPPWVRSPDADSTNACHCGRFSMANGVVHFTSAGMPVRVMAPALRPPRHVGTPRCSRSGPTGCDGRAGNAGPELSNRLTRASIHCGRQILCAILNRYARTRGQSDQRVQSPRSPWLP